MQTQGASAHWRYFLCASFFLSGAAAVSFEALWFRVLGITLGNGFWASNIVLASFMGGLAAGSALAARYAKRVRRPLQLYALIEVVVGVTGVLMAASESAAACGDQGDSPRLLRRIP